MLPEWDHLPAAVRIVPIWGEPPERRNGSCTWDYDQVALVMKTLLFDLDGTLTDPKEGITRSIVHALEKMGYAAPAQDRLTFAIGPPLRDSLAALMSTDDAVQIEAALTAFRERFTTLGLYENRLYPGIVELLAEAKARRHRIYLATSKPLVYARRILAHFQIEHRFDGAYGPDLAGRHSDKAELLAHLLAEEGLAPDDCTMIGDRKHDVLAARSHRIRAVGVTWGYGSREELEAAGADAWCDEPREVLEAAG